MSPRLETVYFGSGCFWRRQHLFDQLRGVVATRTGYMGGWKINPTYTQVISKSTGHAEVVEVTFNTNETKFRTLLKAFFSFHDATIDRRGDGGPYRSVVFCRKAKQLIVAQRSIDLLQANGLEVVTEVKEATLFWKASPRHQNYVERTGRNVEEVPLVSQQKITLLEAAQLTQ